MYKLRTVYRTCIRKSIGLPEPSLTPCCTSYSGRPELPFPRQSTLTSMPFLSLILLPFAFHVTIPCSLSSPPLCV